jgi:chromosome segregation ATPase
LYGMSPLRGPSLLSSSSPRGVRVGMNPAKHNSIRNSSPLRGTGVDYTSTTSLLQEITVLRARLRELEDDNKSSVISSNIEEDNAKLNELVQSLRNDFTKLQQEKAVQEKELLNQISILQADHTKQLQNMQETIRQKEELNNLMNDKLRIVVLQKDELNDQLTAAKDERSTLSTELQSTRSERDELQVQLKQAKMESAISRSKTDTEDKYTRLLEDQRETHMKELEQMKVHLANADLEIEESRSEMDQLHGEIEEMQSYREALLEEVTTVRLNLTEEKRVSQSLRKELGETKRKVEKFQEKEKDVNKKQEPLMIETSGSSEGDGAEENRPITPAEKAQLVKDMNGLEQRLVQFHSKLADKECKIDDLTASLAEERQMNKKLRKEIQQLQSSKSSKSRSPMRHRASLGGSSVDTQSELATLRQQNKALIEEVEELLKAASQRADSSSSPYRAKSSTSCIPASLGRSKIPPPSLHLPPNLNRTAAVANDEMSPRTPVSGLVATFERGLNGKNRSSAVDDKVPTTDAEETIEDLRDQLRCEKLLVLDLQKQLRTDKEVIWDMQEKLRAEKSRNAATESESRGSGFASPTSLAAELREARKENERLQAKLRDVDRMPSNQGFAAKERAELNKLRSDAVYASMERDDNEQAIKNYQQEIQRLRAQLKQRTKHGNNLSSFFEEKKLDRDDEVDLRKELMKKEEELERVLAMHHKYEDETEEELGRLRSQVDALQSELEIAMTKIESLQRELGGSGMDRKSIQHKLKTLESELAASKAQYADLMVEHSETVKELEDKIERLESSCAVSSSEAQARSDLDDDKKTLTEELNKSQIQRADFEIEASMKVKDLENRIRSLEVELEEEKKEKESLQKCLKAAEAASNDAPKLNAEIERLSSQLTAAQLNKTNSDRENMEKLRNLEEELEILELEATEDLAKKSEEMEALMIQLERKEEDIQRLEKEKQQLCLSINDVTSSRRGEMEELQAELLDMTTKTKSQGREIQALKMKLEEYEARKEDVSAKLNRRIRELEDEIRHLNDNARKTYGDRDSLLQLKSENAQLRETLRDVKIERRNLKEKLDSLTQDRSSSHSAQLIRDRNNELQDEVDKLTKRLKKMEASITRFAI